MLARSAADCYGSSDRYANIPNQGNMGAFPVDSEEEAGFNLALFTAVVATTIVVVGTNDVTAWF